MPVSLSCRIIISRSFRDMGRVERVLRALAYPERSSQRLLEPLAPDTENGFVDSPRARAAAYLRIRQGATLE